MGRIASFENDTGLPLTLENFIGHHHLELDDIYKKASWSRLCVMAGRRPDFNDPDEKILSKGLRRFCHNRGVPELTRLLSALNGDISETALNLLNDESRKLLTMFCFSIWNSKPPGKSSGENLHRLQLNPVLMEEVIELIAMLINRADIVVHGANLPFACPYYFLGPAAYVSHSGSRPMSVIWQLLQPMPGKLIKTTQRLAVA